MRTFLSIFAPMIPVGLLALAIEGWWFEIHWMSAFVGVGLYLIGAILSNIIYNTHIVVQKTDE